jgi:hypothetical protein
LKTVNQRFRLDFKLEIKDYKRATNIKREKRLVRLERKGTRRGNDCHPPDLGIISQGYLYNALLRYNGCPNPRLDYYGH